MKTIIHVNQHNIKHNSKAPFWDKRPVLIVKTPLCQKYATEVQILGPSKVVYNPDKALFRDMPVWIETEAEVVLVD